MSNYSIKIIQWFSFSCAIFLCVSTTHSGEPDLNETHHHPVGNRDISEADSDRMREDRVVVAQRDEEDALEDQQESEHVPMNLFCTKLQ